MQKASIRIMLLSALFAALTAICAQIQIPLVPVPINLALFAVLLSGAALGPRYGTISVFVYLLLGAAGVPVFSGFRGGLAALAGNTGGYLAGYAVCAFLTGILCRQRNEIIGLCLRMIPGTIACYTIGTIWLSSVAGLSPAAALSAGVLPFLPGDAVKIILASLLTRRLRAIPSVRAALPPGSGKNSRSA